MTIHFVEIPRWVQGVVLAVPVLVGTVGMPGMAQAQLYNPCPYTNDGDCDEPNGLGYCAWGTDTADCSNPNSNFGGGSGYSGGGGNTGGSGYTGGWSATGGLMNPCPYVNDGDCDEPEGLGYCAEGTDVADCANPYSNYGHGSGYTGGVQAPPQGPGSPTTGGLRAQAIRAIQNHRYVPDAAFAECVVERFERNLSGNDLTNVLRYFIYRDTHGFPGTPAERDAASAALGVSRSFTTQADFNFEAARAVCHERR